MTATLEAESANEPTAAAPRQFAAFIAAVPIFLVNTLAVIGQCQWASTHLHWGRPGQALFAGALETTALAVMYLAHTALIEGDSAWRQKVFAYAIAAGSASVNWQEHSDGWHPTPPAFVFAGASLLSPILWATYSRFAARTVMRDAGLIDKRAAKFSLARWVMFPRKTFKALRYSVWFSVQSPAEAIDGSQGDTAATPTLGDTDTRPKPPKRKKKTDSDTADSDRLLSDDTDTARPPTLDTDDDGKPAPTDTDTETSIDTERQPDTDTSDHPERSMPWWGEKAAPLYRRWLRDHNGTKPTAPMLADLLKKAGHDVPAGEVQRRKIRAATEAHIAANPESSPEPDPEPERVGATS